MRTYITLARYLSAQAYSKSMPDSRGRLTKHDSAWPAASGNAIQNEYKLASLFKCHAGFTARQYSCSNSYTTRAFIRCKHCAAIRHRSYKSPIRLTPHERCRVLLCASTKKPASSVPLEGQQCTGHRNSRVRQAMLACTNKGFWNGLTHQKKLSAAAQCRRIVTGLLKTKQLR